MDPQGVSAFMRVFDALLPAGDALKTSARIPLHNNLPFPPRFRRSTRWLVRSLYFPVFLQIRIFHPRVSRSQTTHTSSFPRRVFAPGFCIVASLTPNRGVGGAPRNVRVQRHPWGVS